MDAAAARQFRPAVEPFRSEERAQPKSGLEDERPFDAFTRIENEDHQVRPFNIVDRSGPRVHLDHADVDQPEQASNAVDPQANAPRAIRLANFQRVHRRR